ncbi:MAG: outer membrane beta-barrel protein, partial [Candidatus Nitrotoga sp.]
MYKTKLVIIALSTSFMLPAAAANGFSSLFKDNGIEVGGWINAGITYNANNPTDRFNGPVTFADRSKEFQLNQLNVFIQRAVATEGKEWNFGGRFDLMFGTDAIFAQA